MSFGLENLGVPQNVIRRRVGEMASYFGIQDWFRKKTDELSGGQKQLLNLASVMVMQPKVLILDEPKNNQDAESMKHMREVLRGLAKEGVTMIIATHMLEDVQMLCNVTYSINNGILKKEDSE